MTASFKETAPRCVREYTAAREYGLKQYATPSKEGVDRMETLTGFIATISSVSVGLRHERQRHVPSRISTPPKIGREDGAELASRVGECRLNF